MFMHSSVDCCLSVQFSDGGALVMLTPADILSGYYLLEMCHHRLSGSFYMVRLCICDSCRMTLDMQLSV